MAKTPGVQAPRRETSQTLERGIRLIELLSLPENLGGMTVTEVATALGLGRPMVYRLVATLTDRDFVRYSSGSPVQLGLGIARIGQAIGPLLSIWATPVLRELADTLGATAHLTIADGSDARALAVVDPTVRGLKVAYRAGSFHPLEVGAAGRAILAGRVGRDEIVFSRGELEPNTNGASVPVLAAAPIDCSVGVVSPEELSRDRVEGPIRQAAARLAEIIAAPGH